MQIGILQTGHAAPAMRKAVGDYSDYFALFLRGQGLSFATFNVIDSIFPTSVNDCDGWLITGSKHGAYEDLPWIPPLEDFLRKAYSEQVPIVGICFGHQILAQALGGKVEKFGDGWSVGPTDYDWGGETVRLNAWHQDQVTELPDEAEVLATSDFCPYAALAYGDRALTVQAHPEYDDDAIRVLIEARGAGMGIDDKLEAAKAEMGQPDGRYRLAQEIGDFFRRAHHG